MPLILDRRHLLQLGAFGAGALALPGVAEALTARGFTHNVASGEPSQDSVLLWTRYMASGETRLTVEVSETDSFDRVAASAEATAHPDRDHTVKVTVSGLRPGRWYYYRFRGPGSAVSPVGRTRTLPDGPTGRFALGVFSCSNLPFGWFNAYGHAAARSDLDLMVHLGDYLYEYPRGNYPTLEQTLAGRLLEPAGETIHLADYRLRHAAYRADPDLRRLHQNFPMIAMWDDHEITNDPWRDGAQNHQPESEGDWAVRKAAAVRAYREWMPVSDDDYAEYRIGDLATLFRPETRLVGRDKQLDRDAPIAGQSDLRAALTAFRDGPWQDSARSMLGAEQERRLADGLRQSVAQGVRWQVLAQQVIVGSLAAPLDSANWPRPNATDPAVIERVRIGLLASSLGLPSGLDRWDGYPAARARLLRSAQDAQANLVILSGDSHNAWAFDLDHEKQPAGVELAGQSVTSPGYEALLPAMSPRDVERAMIGRNAQLKWANLERRGYLTVELTPARATGEWLFLGTIRERSTALAGQHRLSVEHGRNRFG
jgi:alkaline phosphatase D